MTLSILQAQGDIIIWCWKLGICFVFALLLYNFFFFKFQVSFSIQFKNLLDYAIIIKVVILKVI